MLSADRHIFISYARSDTAKVGAIIDSLRQAGLDVWIDREGIKGATFWRKEIVEAIAQCSVVLFFASRHSCASDNVSKELALASEEGKPILPVFIEPAELSPELRFQVAGVQNIAWHLDRDLALRQIIAVLESYTKQSFPSKIGRPLPPRQWLRSRWLTVAAGAIMAIALLALVEIHRSLGPPDAVAEPTAVISQPLVLPQTPLVQPPYQLQNAYYLETVIQKTDHDPFLGLHLRYKVLVTQDGQTLDVRGEKIGEMINGEETTLSGRAKTSIHLQGHVETTAAGSPHIVLTGDEGSTSRDGFSTMFDLQLKGELLTGTFNSTAANASGTAVWIPEKMWNATGWATP